jgi:hypothetical protein
VQTHVKVLGVLFIVLGVMGLVVAAFLLLAIGVAGGIVRSVADSADAAIALPILGLAGTGLAIFLSLLSAPGLVAGIGLLRFRPWARILGLVVAILDLIHFPFGTVLGVYGIWVLLSKETEALFLSHRAVP